MWARVAPTSFTPVLARTRRDCMSCNIYGLSLLDDDHNSVYPYYKSLICKMSQIFDNVKVFHFDHVSSGVCHQNMDINSINGPYVIDAMAPHSKLFLFSSMIATAPMLQWSDVNWRFLMRQISSRTLLYTEMINATNFIHYCNKNTKGQGNVQDFLGDPSSPSCDLIAVQLGGNNPSLLAEAAYMCESYGDYHEINLNCGCPSNKGNYLSTYLTLIQYADLS